MVEEKQMDIRNNKPGIEIVFMAYNVILAGVWVLRAGQESVTPLMVFLHVGLAFLLLEMPRVGSETRFSLRILARFYPYLMWTLAWSEIGWLYNLTLPLVHDGSIKAADLAILGFHLNEEMSSFLSWTWLRNIMGLSYLSYYLLILGPPVALALRRRERELEYHTFGLLSTYLVCFVIYLVLPVLGPRDLAQSTGEVATGVGGLFGAVINAFFDAGDSLGTAFPSSHCAGSVAAALLIRRHFSRTTGLIASIWAGFIVVSTVYTNNHYAIDAVAGVAIAILVQILVSLYMSRPSSIPAPVTLRVVGTGLNLPGQNGPGRKGELS
jgi:membrane-associated phospholipid phosphatase